MDIKNFASTKKGQLIICCSLLGIVWIIILGNYISSLFGGIPSKNDIAKVKRELATARKAYDAAKLVHDENELIRERYRAIAAQAWIPSHDGAAETALRRKIRDVARVQDFKLNNIGSVRVTRVNDDFSYADIDISGNGEFDDVVRLLGGFAKISPQLSWRRLDLRPDNRFQRNTGAGSANLAAQVNTVPETRLFFSGTLRVFCYTGRWSVKDLKITRPAAAIEELEEIAE